MKTARIFLGLVMLCGTAFGTPAPIITTTPTDGPTTITVHARTTDGKLPVDVSCTAVFISDSYTGNTPPILLPQRNGDWMARNVTPCEYEVSLRSSNYADETQTIDVDAGTNYFIDFLLSKGTTFKGRVLDDATDKPIADQRIFVIPSTHDQIGIRTDAEGRYEFLHVVGSQLIGLFGTSNNYVRPVIKMDAADEGNTVSVPDIRLRRGGWISGRLERPVELASNAIVFVETKIQDGLQTNIWIDGSPIETNGTFRIYSLPAGAYTLDADWIIFETNGNPLLHRHEMGSVSNIIVVAGQETTNVFIPMKMLIRTNSAGGR